MPPKKPKQAKLHASKKAKSIDKTEPISPAISVVDTDATSPALQLVPVVAKKKKKRKKDGFKLYVFKMFQRIEDSKNYGISRRAVMVMESLVLDLMERTASEAAELVAHGKKKTMGYHEVLCAAKLMMKGELTEHVLKFAMRSLALYRRSRQMDAINRNLVNT